MTVVKRGGLCHVSGLGYMNYYQLEENKMSAVQAVTFSVQLVAGVGEDEGESSIFYILKEMLR